MGPSAPVKGRTSWTRSARWRCSRNRCATGSTTRSPRPPGRSGARRRPRSRPCPLHSARFHLDKLVDAGLLEVSYARISGRSGPGAGRPAKLYRRSAVEVAVSLPRRSYDLVGSVLASALERTLAGDEVAESLRDEAHTRGRTIGAAYDGSGDDLDRASGVLAERGLRAAPRGWRGLPAELPVRRARRPAHGPGLRGQPRLRDRRPRRSGVRVRARPVAAGCGALLRPAVRRLSRRFLGPGPGAWHRVSDPPGCCRPPMLDVVAPPRRPSFAGQPPPRSPPHRHGECPSRSRSVRPRASRPGPTRGCRRTHRCRLASLRGLRSQVNAACRISLPRPRPRNSGPSQEKVLTVPNAAKRLPTTSCMPTARRPRPPRSTAARSSVTLPRPATPREPSPPDPGCPRTRTSGRRRRRWLRTPARTTGTSRSSRSSIAPSNDNRGVCTCSSEGVRRGGRGGRQHGRHPREMHGARI